MTTAMEKLQAENTTLKQRIAELEQERITTPAASADSAPRSSQAAFQADELELFRTILESSPDNILIWDEHYNYLYANQAAIDQVGTTRDMVIGKNIRDGLGHIPDFMQVWMNRIDHVIATGETLHREESLQIGDITATSISTMFPVRDKAGKVYAMGLIYRDITERKRTEEQLSLFKLLVDNSPDGIGIADSQGIFTYVNPAYGALTGYGKDMIGMSVNDLLPDNSEVDAGVVIGAIMQGDGFWRGELTYQHKDGTPLPIQASVFVAYDDRGEILGIPAIVRDITEQQRREKELHQQAQIQEQVRGSIVVVDMQGIITSWNRDSARLFGYTAEEIIGKPIASLYPPEEQERLITEVIGPLQEQGELETESMVWTKTGERFPVLLSLSLLRDDSGTPVGMIGFSTDLREQKQMEAERAAMQEQIIDAQRSALRELSTPLIPITDEVVIMPLIGTLDSGRAQQVMEALLEGVSQYQADLVILDITGVSVVDTQVAQAFIQAAQAVRLLGAQVMLTGIQPQIAQTLVHLGVDLSSIQTQGSLQAGIAAALKKRQHA
jgi:rsbT co-antagonist protein RsbR